ncbi:MAG: hypothetical protein GY856_16310 [bacterium]|nr:hypothetical protein [bacterium]
MRNHELVENFLQAFEARDHQRLAALAAEGADVNARDQDGLTFLMRASTLGDETLVATLLEAGADVDARSHIQSEQPQTTKAREGTALMFAAENGHLETVEALLAAGADPNIEDRGEGTALLGAALAGHVAVVARLLDAGGQAWGEALNAAVSQGHGEVARLLIDAGADVGDDASTGSSAPLATAARVGRADMVRLLFDAGASCARMSLENPFTNAVLGGNEELVALLLERLEETGDALHIAIRKGHVGIARLLIAAGADLAHQDLYNRDPLLCAVGESQPEIARQLIAAGADVNLRPLSGLRSLRFVGRTPLMVAASLGQAETVRELLAAGAEIDVRIDTAEIFPDPDTRPLDFELPDEGSNAMMLAAKNGHPEVVRQLLAAGGLDAEADGSSLGGLAGANLLAAIQRGDAAEVATLLDGVDFHAGEKNDHGIARSAVVRAAKLGHGEIIRALIAAGAEVDATVEGGTAPFDRTALMLAAEQGHVEAVRTLLAAGANPEARDRDAEDHGGKTALMLAAANGHAQVLEVLKDAGAKLNVRSNEGTTALAYAAEAGHLEAVRRLIALGAKVGIGRQQALFNAAAKGHHEVIGALIEGGADVNGYLRMRGSALSAAIDGGHVDMVRFLLQAGADPTLDHSLSIAIIKINSRTIRINDQGEVFDDGADVNGKQAMMDALLDAGADVNAVFERTTPLESVVLSYMDPRAKSALVEKLLRHGADPNRASKGGMTMLANAAERGEVEVVKSLIEAGAELNAVDKQGRTALDCAIDNQHPDVVELLEGLGAAKERNRSEIVEDQDVEDKGQDEKLPMAEMRGVLSFDGTDMMALVKASVDEVAEAFKEHCEAEIWEQDVYGQEVEYTDSCYIVFRFRGHPWTVIREQFTGKHGRFIEEDDAQAVSEDLGVPAIYFAHCDTAGYVGYRYYESGRLLEWLENGEEDDGAQFGEEDEADLGEEAMVSFGSELRDVDPAEIAGFCDFVDDFFRDLDAFVPSWGIGRGGKAGKKYRLEIDGIEPEDIARMDFVAVK